MQMISAHLLHSTYFVYDGLVRDRGKCEISEPDFR